MNGAVAHWQMITKDPDATARFYEALFGWHFSANNGMGYREVSTNAHRGIDGGIWPAPPEAPETVQLYIEVGDIDASLGRVEALGGRVIMPKQILPDGDAMALAMDPLGRTFGLMSSSPDRAAIAAAKIADPVGKNL